MPAERLHDRKPGRAADHDEDAGQNENDHRKSQEDRQAGRLFLKLGEHVLAHLCGQHAQRLAERGAELHRLDQRAGKAAHRFQPGAVAQRDQRHAAVGADAHLRGADRQLHGDCLVGEDELLRHALDRAFQAKAGLGADHHHVERVREAAFDLFEVGAAHRLDDEIGRDHAADRGAADDGPEGGQAVALATDEEVGDRGQAEHQQDLAAEEDAEDAAAAQACLGDCLFELGAGGVRQDAGLGDGGAELGDQVEQAHALAARGQGRAAGIRAGDAREAGAHALLLVERAQHGVGADDEEQGDYADQRQRQGRAHGKSLLGKAALDDLEHGKQPHAEHADGQGEQLLAAGGGEQDADVVRVAHPQHGAGDDGQGGQDVDAGLGFRGQRVAAFARGLALADGIGQRVERLGEAAAGLALQGERGGEEAVLGQLVALGHLDERFLEVNADGHRVGRAGELVARGCQALAGDYLDRFAERHADAHRARDHRERVGELGEQLAGDLGRAPAEEAAGEQDVERGDGKPAQRTQQLRRQQPADGGRAEHDQCDAPPRHRVLRAAVLAPVEQAVDLRREAGRRVLRAGGEREAGARDDLRLEVAADGGVSPCGPLLLALLLGEQPEADAEQADQADEAAAEQQDGVRVHQLVSSIAATQARSIWKYIRRSQKLGRPRPTL